MNPLDQTPTPTRPAVAAALRPCRSLSLAATAAVLVAATTPALLVTGCGAGKLDKYLPDQRLEYKRAREAEENLELPPDLAGGSFDDAMDIPAPGGTTYSDYAGERAARTDIARSGDVLPAVSGVTLERSGDKRWLEINATPKAVWPRLISFWRQQGILLTEQNPAVGVMQTDWIENRAEVRGDFITRQLRKVVDGLYSTSTRDQYRVRIDAGQEPGTTEVFMTHSGMQERLVRNTVGEGSTTVWEPAPGDPEKEALMLRRLMLYLGVSDKNADQMLAQGGGSAPAEQAAPRPAARLEGGELVVPTDFRGAWREVGLALDSSGFAVEDRDRSAGVFFVRYVDADRPRERKGLVSRMAFWKGSGKKGVEQYQVRLVEQNGATVVTVHDADGKRDSSDTAERILGLIKEQMR